MSNKTNSGPFAFPSSALPDSIDVDKGMTLRDYFAGLAMQGIMANSHTGYGTEKDSPMSDGIDYKILADVAYEMAAAMIQAREDATTTDER